MVPLAPQLCNQLILKKLRSHQQPGGGLEMSWQQACSLAAPDQVCLPDPRPLKTLRPVLAPLRELLAVRLLMTLSRDLPAVQLLMTILRELLAV